MISFIIPAHNEAFEIERTLDSVRRAAEAVGLPFELLVVNDASTDSTPVLARAAGAKILDVQLRKISAVRNAGARVATGDVFFFIDADTRVSAVTLSAALGAIAKGAVGGGACVIFDQPAGWLSQAAIIVFSFFYMRLVGWAAGCFLYTTRVAFEAVGGFDERLYAAEEIALSMALKRQGRFVVLRETVTTSARKLRMYSAFRIVPLAGRFLRYGFATLQRREGLDWWYDGKREGH